MRFTAGFRAGAIAGLLLATAACEKNASGAAVAGAMPFNEYAVGPQPGPDRPFPRAVNPTAGNAQARVEGRRLFVWYNCSGCHGDHGGGGMGPSLRDSTWLYGGDDASIYASITEGRQHGMPAWGTKLPREQIWKLTTYIQSLRTDDEPDPPR